MKTTTKRALLIGATAVVALPLLAFAGGGFGPGAGIGRLLHGGHGDMDHAMLAERILGHLDERLELTEAQSEELRALLEVHRLENEARWEEMKVATAALHETMMSDTFDETAVRAAARDTATVAEELAVSHAALMSEARTVFTPEQIEELEAMHEDRGHRRHERRQRRMHGEAGATG